eukprot:scaffold105933_cov21-Phaeocystis_antarctica.AAC.1
MAFFASLHTTLQPPISSVTHTGRNLRGDRPYARVISNATPFVLTMSMINIVRHAAGKKLTALPLSSLSSLLSPSLLLSLLSGAQGSVARLGCGAEG